MNPFALERGKTKLNFDGSFYQILSGGSKVMFKWIKNLILESAQKHQKSTY